MRDALSLLKNRTVFGWGEKGNDGKGEEGE
jgi:hypothetical protein